jgi:MoxR-like ATPase
VVLERRALPDGSGERIGQQIEPGGILTAEVCVLDDLSRAPGEALNILLRILNERRFGSEPIPLLTAIATGNPLRDDYYNEPLDPANLDRFAIQLRVSGLLQSGDAQAARDLVDRFAELPELAEQVSEPVMDRAAFGELHRALLEVELPGPVKDGLLEILRVLIEERGVNEENGLLTDRTFLVKALKLVRGRALLRGRMSAALEDLQVLEWMMTFRVPEQLRPEIPELIRRVAGV